MIIFKNYQELYADKQNIAKKVLKEKGQGNWQKEEILYYDDLENFAFNELRECWVDSWYEYDSFTGEGYINLQELRESISMWWDESIYYLCNTGEVLSTKLGW